jgi:oligosaccharide repeat unit polymerase
MLPWLTLLFKKPDIIYEFTDKSKYVKVVKGLSFILLILLFLGFILLGGTPIFNMILGKLNVDEYNASLINLPFGFLTLILSTSILLNLYLSSFIANRSYYNITYLFIASILLLCLFGALWQGKRQGLLMLIFMIAARLAQRKSNKSVVKKITTAFITFIVAVTFFFIFTQVSKVRTNSSETDSYELISYAMYPAMNMVTIIDHFPTYGSAVVPKHIVSEIIPWRFASGGDEADGSFLFEPTSPSGYFSNWYMDYGYLGVILGALFMSFISKYFFFRRNRSEHHMRIYIFVLWCCATAGVYSHLINLNFFIFPFLILLAINKIKFSFK